MLMTGEVVFVDMVNIIDSNNLMSFYEFTQKYLNQQMWSYIILPWSSLVSLAHLPKGILLCGFNFGLSFWLPILALPNFTAEIV